MACETAKEALAIITSDPPNIIVSDMKLPDGNGLQVLWAMKKLSSDAVFILITGHASVETAIEAINQGAFAYHVKPLDIDALTNSVGNALKQQRLVAENRDLLHQLQQANEGLQLSNSRLGEKNRELETLSEAKTQILATATHELKTPLTSIVGYVDLMLEQDRVGALNERQARYLKRVERNARRLQALIGDLLDISRIESGSLVLALEELELRRETEEVVRSSQREIEDKQIRVLLNISQATPRIKADRLRFSQIVGNLLSNACKYSPRGSAVAIDATENGGLVQIDVADTGAGISPEDQGRLFTKFFRADNSSTREVSGTGLGLFITKHMVEAHSGDIWVHSEEGKGSTFSFTLPTVNGSTKHAEAPEKVWPDNVESARESVAARLSADQGGERSGDTSTDTSIETGTGAGAKSTQPAPTGEADQWQRF